MTHEDYCKRIDEAGSAVGHRMDCWNALYELELLKRGLRIVAEQPPRHPLGNDCMALVPVKGLSYSYPYPSWIIEA